MVKSKTLDPRELVIGDGQQEKEPSFCMAWSMHLDFCPCFHHPGKDADEGGLESASAVLSPIIMANISIIKGEQRG